jgi:hypothetical protein
MGLFCAEADLANESDVEQKVILPLLRQEPPLGFGFQPAEIKSKPDIRRFEIDKGESKKLYYPDYVIVIGGLPVLIVEAKGPGEDVATARREARLYAGELNAIFPPFKNPCRFTLVSNGKTTSVQAWDSDAPLASFALDEADPANLNFGKVFEVLQAKSLREFSYEQLSRMFQKRFFRPLNMVGGQSVRNEEIAPNTFGTALVFKFRHLFNPVTREDRAFIVRNAYIPSQRRERYIQQIDKIIRAAASPSSLLKNSEKV